MTLQCNWTKELRKQPKYNKLSLTYIFQLTPLKSVPQDSTFSLNQLSTLDQKSSPWAMRPLAGVLLRFLAGASRSVGSSCSETSSSSTPRMFLFSQANRRYDVLVDRIQKEEVENIPRSHYE